MRITVDAKAFRTAVDTACLATPKRYSSQPICNNVLLSALDGDLTITGTDLETIISHAIKCEGGNGAITVPAKALAAWLKGTTGTVTIVVEDTSVTVQAGARSTTMQAISADDFPPMPSVGDTTAAFFPAKQFAQALKQTTCAMASDDSRPVLAGLLLEVGDHGLRLVAIDGSRLASYDIAIGSLPPAQAIASPGIKVLSKILGEGLDFLQWDDRNLRVTSGATQFTTMLIQGTYPYYQQLIPVVYATRITADRKTLLAAVQGALPVAKDDSSIVRLSYAGNALRVHASSAAGSYSKTVAVQAEGPDANTASNIALNGKYLVDLLKSCADASVIIDLTSPSNPGVFHLGGCTTVIMPMVVKWG